MFWNIIYYGLTKNEAHVTFFPRLFYKTRENTKRAHTLLSAFGMADIIEYIFLIANCLHPPHLNNGG